MSQPHLKISTVWPLTIPGHPVLWRENTQKDPSALGLKVIIICRIIFCDIRSAWKFPPYPTDPLASLKAENVHDFKYTSGWYQQISTLIWLIPRSGMGSDKLSIRLESPSLTLRSRDLIIIHLLSNSSAGWDHAPMINSLNKPMYASTRPYHHLTSPIHRPDHDYIHLDSPPKEHPAIGLIRHSPTLHQINFLHDTHPFPLA